MKNFIQFPLFSSSSIFSTTPTTTTASSLSSITQTSNKQQQAQQYHSQRSFMSHGSGPPLTEIVATTTTSNSSTSPEEEDDVDERKTHIEVCVRIRPLKVGKESSTSFLSSSSSSSTTTTSKGTTTTLHNNNNSKNSNNNNTNGTRRTSNLPSGLSRPSQSKLATPTRHGTTATTTVGPPRSTRSAIAKLTPDRHMKNKGNSSSSNIPGPGNSTTTNNNYNNNNQDEDESCQSYAWNVNAPNTIQQNPDLIDNVPGRTNSYTLDHVYGPDSTTCDLFQQSVLNLVKASMDGYHTSILAYGQTSTGKTHTMTGTADQPGLIPLSIRGCFDYLKHMLHPREFLLRLSYMEVYKEHIRDLLAPSTENAAPIRLFETAADGLVIKGLREEVVTCPEQVFALLAEGESRRQVGATHLNAHSSRSHVIVRLWIESRALPEGISAGGGGGLGQRITSTSSSTSSLASSSRLGPHVRISSLSLVDLAGSESVRLTGNNDRRQEGHYINQSLMTLGKVVYALSEIGDGSPGGGSSSNNNNKKSLKQQHIPYRDSKLTRLLQPSLSGNAQLMLVCCISPLAQHMEESHNTCKFAIRAKKIPQKATIQEAPSDDRTLLQSYRVEIEDLKQQLREAEEAKKLLLEQGSSSSSPTSVSATIPIARSTVPPSSQEQQHQLQQQQQQQRSSGGLLAEDVVSEDEIKELVSSIQTMEKLILKSKPISPTTTNTTTTTFQRPEDLMDSEHWDDDDAHNIDDEEDLLALATTKSEGGATTTTTSASTSMIDSPTTTRSAQTPTMGSTASSTDEMDKNLQIELSRIQGLLGSVLMKRKSRQHHHQQQGGVFFSSMSSSITATTTSTTNTTTPVTSSCSSDQEVAHLRAQLEQQELTTTIRKADSSFLQKQLEEKDDLLMEVSKVLEALEKENANLRNELAILQCAAAAQNNQNNNQKQ